MKKIKREKKSGFITEVEKNDVLSRAKRTLKQVKESAIEKDKVPYRIDHRTIIMVSKSKYKELIKNKNK